MPVARWKCSTSSRGSLRLNGQRSTRRTEVQAFSIFHSATKTSRTAVGKVASLSSPRIQSRSLRATVIEMGIDCVSTCDRLAPKSFWKPTIVCGFGLVSAISLASGSTRVWQAREVKKVKEPL